MYPYPVCITASPESLLKEYFAGDGFFSFELYFSISLQLFPTTLAF